MDIFYIDTIEQVIASEESEYTINEYGKREQWKLPYEQVQAKYFKKLSDVAADLIGGAKENAQHYYMDIKIVDSDGNIHDKDKLGTKQPVDPKPEPNETPVEEG